MPLEIPLNELIYSAVFYGFSAIVFVSVLGVITVRNPVHAVLLMILAFFTSAALFMMQGAEFLGLLLIIVYVGAIAVLFLFVIMMLEIRTLERKAFDRRDIPLAVLIGGILIAELLVVVLQGHIPGTDIPPPTTLIGNTKAIGLSLYSDYIYIFEIVGVLLLLAMLGAIVLTHRRRPDLRRQKVAAQLARKSVIEVVDVAKQRKN